MKLFTLYLVGIFCILLHPSQAQIIDLGVAVFDEANFEGRHTFFSENRVYETSFGIESIRIPPGWVVTVFTAINFEGQQKVLKESCNLDDSMKNEIRSIRIDQKIGINAQYSNWDLKLAPAEGYITLFGNPSFKIERARIKDDWIFDGWHTIRSISIPEGWEIWLYKNTHFEGSYLVLNTSWDGTGPERKEWRDQIKSIKVVRKPVRTAQYVSTQIEVFDQALYKGQSCIISGNWSCHSLENHSWNNCISSIRIPPGVRVVVFENPDFRGKSFTLTSSTSLLGFWNNQIGSIQVFRAD